MFSICDCMYVVIIGGKKDLSISHSSLGFKSKGAWTNFYIKLNKPYDIFTLYLGHIMKGDLITQHKSTIHQINRMEHRGHGEVFCSD